MKQIIRLIIIIVFSSIISCFHQYKAERIKQDYLATSTPKALIEYLDKEGYSIKKMDTLKTILTLQSLKAKSYQTRFQISQCLIDDYDKIGVEEEFNGNIIESINLVIGGLKNPVFEKNYECHIYRWDFFSDEECELFYDLAIHSECSAQFNRNYDLEPINHFFRINKFIYFMSSLEYNPKDLLFIAEKIRGFHESNKKVFYYGKDVDKNEYHKGHKGK